MQLLVSMAEIHFLPHKAANSASFLHVYQTLGHLAASSLDR